MEKSCFWNLSSAFSKKYPCHFFLWWTKYQYEPKEFEESNDLKYSYFEDPNRYSFDFWYRETLTKNSKFLDTILNDFDSVEYVLVESSVPQMDNDPMSETYGEDLLILDSTGEWVYIYPDPIIFFGW